MLESVGHNISSNEHKKLILMIKSNHQIPNMVIKTSSALDTIIIISYYNTNIRHQKLSQ